jgi:hypothetical protein
MSLDINMDSHEHLLESVVGIGDIKNLLGDICAKIAAVLEKVESIESQNKYFMERLVKIEETSKKQQEEIADLKSEVNILKQLVDNHFDPKVTIVEINLPLGPNDDKDLIASHLVRALGGNNFMIRDVTTAGGQNGKKPVLKVELKTVENKIQLLREKSKLKDSGLFRNTYIRSSMTHFERIMDANIKSLIKELPEGHGLRVTGNGRIIRENQRGNPPHPNNGQNRQFTSTPAYPNRQYPRPNTQPIYKSALQRNESSTTGSPSQSLLEHRV